MKRKVPKYKVVIHHKNLWMPKVDVLCSFLCFGCVLFVCKFIVFDFCSSIELNCCVGDGVGW